MLNVVVDPSRDEIKIEGSTTNVNLSIKGQIKSSFGLFNDLNNIYIYIIHTHSSYKITSMENL